MKKTAQRIIILASLIAAVGLFVLFLSDILIPFIRMELANDIDGAKELLASRGVLGFLSVVLVEALQMVVVFIPAEFIQISSGLSYPFYIALLLCDLGVCVGATIIYVLVTLFRFSSNAYERNEKKIEKLAAMTHQERKDYSGEFAPRSDVIVFGGCILSAFMEYYKFDSITVSDRDSLEGYMELKGF